jgi:hypothetical protein
MKTILPYAGLSALVLSLVGCGPFYHLPGHHASNLYSLPPITMNVGQTREMMSSGLERHLAVPAYGVASENEKIVKVESNFPAHDATYRVWLVALKPGKTRIHYSSPPSERSFDVTVLKADS